MQVKAAFTRAYNKEAHLTPYSLQVIKTPRSSTGPMLDSEYSEELPEEDSQSDEKDQDAIESDAMIKVVFQAGQENLKIGDLFVNSFLHSRRANQQENGPLC